MSTKTQIILKHKNNKVDILYSSTTSFDTMEIVQEATSIYKTLDEVKKHLENFKKFSKIAKQTEGFTHLIKKDFDYIILVEDLGNCLFSIHRLRYFEYDIHKNELFKEYTEDLIKQCLLDEGDKQVATLKNGLLFMFTKYTKSIFVETDNKLHKEEDLEFLIDIYFEKINPTSPFKNQVLSYSA